MRTSEEYKRQIDRLGLSHIEISASSIPEANEAIIKVREAQTQLRQIKKDINLDMKAIRAEYRDQSSNAAATSSAIVSIFGKRKLAGSMRADAKRQLSRECNQILQPYEQLKIAIDDLLLQLDSAKAQLQGFSSNVKTEEKASKQAIEETLESLHTVHLATTPPSHIFHIKARSFDVAPPVRPPSKFHFPRKNPYPPLQKSAGWKGKFFKKHQEQIEAENVAAIREYEAKLAEWESEREQAEKEFEAAHQEYDVRNQEWATQKMQFEKAEKQRIVDLEQARLSDPNTMAVFLDEHIDSIIWPIPISVAHHIADVDVVDFDVQFPLTEDWPVQQKSATQKRRDYLLHIHSVAFRLIGETFYILPAIKQVTFSGYIWKASKTTGQSQKTYLLSAKVWRTAWEQIDFERLDWVDVVESFNEFDVRRDYNKTAIIEPIEPFNATVF